MRSRKAIGQSVRELHNIAAARVGFLRAWIPYASSLSLVLYIYSVSSLRGGSLGYFWFCKMATPAVVCGAGKLGGEVRVGVEINALSGQ